DHDNARTLISNLRARLEGNALNRAAVEQAWADIRRLRVLISKHQTELTNLRRENRRIERERDSILSREQQTPSKAGRITKQEKKIQQAMKIASALKISAFAINAVRVR